MDKELIALNELLDTAIDEVLKETTDKFKIPKGPNKPVYPKTYETNETRKFHTTNQQVNSVNDQNIPSSQSNTAATQNGKRVQENNSFNQQTVHQNKDTQQGVSSKNNTQTTQNSQRIQGINIFTQKPVIAETFDPNKDAQQGVSNQNNTQTSQNSQRVQVNNRFNQQPGKDKTVYYPYTHSDFNRDDSFGDDYETESTINPAYRRMQKLRHPSETIRQDYTTERQAGNTCEPVQDYQKEYEVHKNVVESKEINTEKKVVHPPLVTRSQWGALPPLIPMEPLQHPAKSIVFSLNTRTRPCTNQNDCQRIVKEIQTRHMGEGLADIQYSFLVGGDGNMYEGRGWNLKSGITDETSDDPNINIAFIGDYADDPALVPRSMLGPVQDLIIYGNSNRLIKGVNMKHQTSK